MTMAQFEIPASSRLDAGQIASRIRRLAARTRPSGNPERAFAAAAALYLLLSALAFFVVRPTTLLYFADYWEHRAIVLEVMRGGTDLLDPIYAENASSRQYTPWSLALGYLARNGGLDVDSVMALGAMAVSVLFVVGVHAFARAFYGHRWAPAVMLAALTCAWGVPALIWTGFHALRSQLHSNYYPASLVFALSFVAWAATLRLLRGERLGVPGAALLWGVVACSVVSHPLNAAFLVAGAVALVMFEPAIRPARRAAVMLVIAAGIASTILWPWFNPLSLAGAGLARGQATFNNFAFFFDPMFVVTLAWPAIFVLLGLPGMVRDPSLRMPLIALAMTFAAYVVGGIADVSVSHRLLAYVVLWLQLLIVKAVLDTIDGRPPRMMDELTPRAWRWAKRGAALLIALQVAGGIHQLVDPWGGDQYPAMPVHAHTERVVATLPADARILGWDSAALVMPSHGVRVAAFPRPMPLSPSDAARQADYRRFFKRGTATCQRLAIAHRWRATHIAYLTHELKRSVQRELRALGPAAAPVPLWRIIPVPPRGAADTNC